MSPRDPLHEDEAALRQRLDALAGAIRAKRPAPAAPRPGAPAKGDDGFGSAMSLGLRAGSEFVAAIAVGALIGLGLDWLLHTRPAFTIAFFLIGVAAGFVNVIRATSPKGSNFDRNSRLSGAKPEDKDVPRDGPRGGERQED